MIHGLVESQIPPFGGCEASEFVCGKAETKVGEYGIGCGYQQGQLIEE